MNDGRRYVRVYYSIRDDPKFDRVRSNVACLGTWLWLLMSADAVWPASADLPRGVTAGNLRILVDCGLIDLLPEHRYRIHGLDAERNARSIAASNAAALRWHPKGNAETMPNRTEHKQRRVNESLSGRERAGARLVEPFKETA